MAAVLTPPIRVYTADDLFAMPADARFELFRGELVPMPPPPGGEHGSVTISLSARATVHVQDHDLGVAFAAETGFKVEADPDTVLAPDWAFIAKGRLSGPVPKRHVPLAPDLVLETRSPSDTPREVALKVQAWLNAGVQVVWVLDPGTRTLTIHRRQQPPHVLGPSNTLTCEDLLPGFELPLERVFA